VVTLDEKHWRGGKRRSSFRNKFLGETTWQTEDKIELGEYLLADLNCGGIAQGYKKRGRNRASRFVGVGFLTKANSWRAYTSFKGRDIHLGYYDLEVEAALARYTFEVWCPNPNRKSKLVEAIRAVWPEFKGGR